MRFLLIFYILLPEDYAIPVVSIIWRQSKIRPASETARRMIDIPGRFRAAGRNQSMHKYLFLNYLN
jgi:hypothetical protein